MRACGQVGPQHPQGPSGPEPHSSHLPRHWGAGGALGASVLPGHTGGLDVIFSMQVLLYFRPCPKQTQSLIEL